MTAETAAGRGALVRPCEANPDGWDLDGVDVPDWLRAIRACTTECPLLRSCIAPRRQMFPDGHPAGVIWAARRTRLPVIR